MGDGLYDPGQFTARLHERDDCVHYLRCLDKAALSPQRSGRHGSGGHVCLPCEGCEEYEAKEPELASAWANRGDYDPWRNW
jgi:hypothetical protein